MNSTTSDANISVAGALAQRFTKAYGIANPARARSVQAVDTGLVQPAEDGQHDQNTGRVESAQRAALAWLILLDAEDYSALWAQCSEKFRDRVNRQAWEKVMQSWRAPFGVAQARKLQAAKLTRTIPAAPLGEYLLLQYQTQFAHAASSMETVTLAKGQDGAWRVSAYYFR